MAHRSLLLCFITAAALYSNATRAQSNSITQTAGDYSVLIAGDNHGNITLNPPQLTKFITKVVYKNDPKQAARVAELEERLERLEAALASATAGAASPQDVALATAELRTSNAVFLEENEAIREQVYEELERAVEVQKDISKVEDPAVRTQAQALLGEAEIDEAAKELFRWERAQGNTSDADKKVGFSLSTASDPNRIAGWAVGMETHFPMKGFYTSHSVSVIWAVALSMVAGNLNDRDERSLLLLADGHFGPRVRIGGPSSALSFGAYYGLPLFMMSNGKGRFPLVGVFGDIGWQVGVSRLSLVYRFTALEVLYPNQRNLTFMGLSFTGTKGDW